MEPDRLLLDFARALRSAGLRPSVAELLDAERAAVAIGLGEREALRAALRASLVKRQVDRPEFEAVFDRYFAVAPAEAGERGEAGEGGRPPSAAEAEALRAAIAAASQSGAGGGGLLEALLLDEAELSLRLAQAEAAVDLGRMVSPMQVGLFSFRVLSALGAEDLDRAMDPLREALRAQLGEERGDALADEAARRLWALRQQVRRRVRRELARRDPDRVRRSREERLASLPFAALSPKESAELEAQVRKLGRALAERMSLRSRRRRRGKIDLRATVRAAQKSAGVPFRPVYRRPPKRKPKLVVLCDISDSVRASARFFLFLLYAIQDVFQKTRSFVFVREVGESTSLFARYAPEEALARVMAGEAVSVAASSDYGHVFTSFEERYGPALDRRTALLVLGDARSNRSDPALERFASLRRRVKRLIWLNPEAPASWGFGDSVMPLYARDCDRVWSANNLVGLRRAVEGLAEWASSPAGFG